MYVCVKNFYSDLLFFAYSINNQLVGTANNMHRQYFFDVTVCVTCESDYYFQRVHCLGIGMGHTSVWLNFLSQSNSFNVL